MFGLNAEELMVVSGGVAGSLILIIKTIKNIGKAIKELFANNSEKLKLEVLEVVNKQLEKQVNKVLEENKDLKRGFAIVFENQASLYTEDPEKQKELLELANDFRS